MDMKRILQAFDGTAEKSSKADSDMKRFVSIIAEGVRPNNRLTPAESIAVNHYTQPETKKGIASPVLNVAEGAKPSMIGKYFKSVEKELEESAGRKKEFARQLAEKAIQKISPRSVIKEENEEDKIDNVTVDVPLLIRLLEYAKEDAKTDMDLHSITEKLIELSKTIDVLSMEQYDAIVGDQLALPAPDENKDGKEDY